MKLAMVKSIVFFIADEPFLMTQFVFIGAFRDLRAEKLVCADQEIRPGPHNRTSAEQRNFGTGPDMDQENFEIRGPDSTRTKENLCRTVDP